MSLMSCVYQLFNKEYMNEWHDKIPNVAVRLSWNFSKPGPMVGDSTVLLKYIFARFLDPKLTLTLFKGSGTDWRVIRKFHFQLRFGFFPASGRPVNHRKHKSNHFTMWLLIEDVKHGGRCWCAAAVSSARLWWKWKPRRSDVTSQHIMFRKVTSFQTLNINSS